MASKNAPQIVSSLVLNALDLFAERVKIPRDERHRSAVQRLAHQWKTLDDADREVVADKIGVVTEVIAAAIPLAVAAAARARASRKSKKTQRKKQSTPAEDTGVDE